MIYKRTSDQQQEEEIYDFLVRAQFFEFISNSCTSKVWSHCDVTCKKIKTLFQLGKLSVKMEIHEKIKINEMIPEFPKFNINIATILLESL